MMKAGSPQVTAFTEFSLSVPKGELQERRAQTLAAVV